MKTSSEIRGPEHNRPVADFLARCRTLVDNELDRLIPAESVEPTNVHRAMRWSLLGGGKRFRPALVIASGETFEAPTDELLSTACAWEMIHAYSLIHDDLPSMDNDEMRRGRATCHIRFSEATAILAGDALQTFAFQIIAEDDRLSADIRVQLLSELTRAAGTPGGMVAGQAQDLEAESRAVSATELQQIHRLKTGALITAAARSGAIIARVKPSELDAVTEYASHLGLLFQITDDLLDVTATVEALGKTPGKDARSQKATYPALFGVNAARDRAAQVHQDACAALGRIDRPTALLYSIADFILQRRA